MSSKQKRDAARGYTDEDLAVVRDNPEWTREDFARAKRADEVLPAELLAGLRAARRPGRPPVEKPKVAVTIRLDPDTVTAFKATGKGWQSRINDALARAAKRLRKSA